MSVQQHSRTGRVLVCILVCMAISLSIMMTSMRGALRNRRQMQTELQMEQTRWMLRAAKSRAARQLADDPEYRGERWNVTQALRGHDLATIRILISSDPDGLSVMTATSQIGDPDRPATITTRSARWIFKDNLTRE